MESFDQNGSMTTFHIKRALLLDRRQVFLFISHFKLAYIYFFGKSECKLFTGFLQKRVLSLRDIFIS